MELILREKSPCFMFCEKVGSNAKFPILMPNNRFWPNNKVTTNDGNENAMNGDWAIHRNELVEIQRKNNAAAVPSEMEVRGP